MNIPIDIHLLYLRLHLGMDEFIQAFTDKYKEIIGGELTAETMPLLTGEQHSLLAYQKMCIRDRCNGIRYQIF